jgi:hypothetical protein
VNTLKTLRIKAVDGHFFNKMLDPKHQHYTEIDPSSFAAKAKELK